MQVVALMEGSFALPPWLDMVVIIILAVGFPLALILAWAQETQAPALAEVHAVAPPETEALSLDPKGVAVLPFENLSPDPDNAYFAAGIHEETLNQLAKIHDLNVIARTSVLLYEDAKKSIPDIAAELGVASVMEGSVRYAGDRVRVTAQLIDGITNVHLWSETYDRNLDDIFGIQSDIALAIAAALRATLTDAETEAITKPPTENIEAYAEFLHAEAEINKGYSIAGYRRALQHYDQAIELDLDFALALARQSGCMMTLFTGFEIAHDPHTPAHALQLAERALELDPLQGAAHWAKGLILSYSNDWDAALASFRRGAELSPGDATTQSGLARHLIIMGRAEEAIPVIERALRIDPLGPVHHNIAMGAWTHLGRIRDAIREQEICVRLSPEVVGNRSNLALLLSMDGRPDDALGQLHIGEELEGASEPRAQLLLAMGYAATGARDQARQIADGFDLDAQGAALRAGYLVRMGDADGAIDLLTRELETRGRLPMFTNSNLSLLPLHDDPRYKALLAKTGLHI